MRHRTFLILPFLFLAFAHAQSTRKTNLEWESIEGADSYEVEVTGLDLNEKSIKKNFKTQQPLINAELPPGDYHLKIRSFDRRKVPGSWSEAVNFKVNIEQVKLISPRNKTSIETNSESTEKVQFRWAELPDIKQYELILTTKKGKKVIKTAKNEIEVDLNVAENYQWQVSAKTENKKIESDLSETFEFNLIGKKLNSPDFKIPETEFVRELNWTSDQLAEKYLFIIDHLIKDEWKTVLKSTTNKNSVPFKKEFPGGKYRIRLQSTASLRINSDLTEKEFIVADGDRSFLAEQIANTKRSITAPDGIYFIGRYFITQMNYFTQSAESGTRTSFTAISGIGGLGMGLTNKHSNFGFIGFIDLGGLAYNNRNVTFSSMDLNMNYNLELTTSKLTFQMGFLYKELPFINKNALGTITQDQVSGSGIHLGLEYWYALTNKIGIQMNGHVYELISKIKSPTNTNFSPSMSTQYGLMGAYRITPQTTGYAGYSARVDLIEFKPSGFAVDNSNNHVSISGDYLNLILETRF